MSKLREAGTDKASKKTPDSLGKVDEQTESNDETSLEELRVVMQDVHSMKMSVSTLHRWREQLGWSAKGTKYCQMIGDNPKKWSNAIAWSIKQWSNTICPSVVRNCLYTRLSLTL